MATVSTPSTSRAPAAPAKAAPVASVLASSPPDPFEIQTEPVSRGRIDDLVFDRLRRMGIKPAHPCSDAVFLRRAYLDVIGTVPTELEVQRFQQDQSSGKRAALIEALLARDEFADYWALKWSDILRVKSEFPINLWPMAAQGYHRWIRTAIKENWPYDRFARALLTASGSNFRDPQVNFYRALSSKKPDEISRSVARIFMGVRSENWPKNRQDNMALFFSQIAYKATGEWKEEIVCFDPAKADLSAPPIVAITPDGTRAVLRPEADPRVHFCDWLISPQNQWFTLNIVNRVWCWLMGRGIIQEPDDIRPDNPPSNPILLGHLEHELVASRYDLKHIYRLILNSQTYQLASIARSTNPAAEANFAQYSVRRLDAEVLIDALDQITGTTEAYSSETPEPFTFIPEDQRSIALADGSITSSFLQLFGRPARDTGLESERNNRLTSSQRLHMLNSSHVQKKIQRGPSMVAIYQSSKNAIDYTDRLYVTILSRLPTEAERASSIEYAKAAGNLRTAAIDLAWALVNSPEFQCRH
ncbi:MAG: DUF1553 domain-containing protein [Capsulimonadaceae bacterium]|nr:DUF1553 domain-containing protein [Capsulimonadaceae bacterium]